MKNIAFLCSVTLLLFSCKKEDLLVADFSIVNNNCIAPCEIRFSNLSKNASAYTWEFGDGETSTEENPTHVYSDWGTFNVKLTAINNDSETSITKEVTLVDTSGSSGTRIISLNGDLNFGDVQINPGTPPVKNFSIKNNGNLTLNVNGVSTPNGFSSDFTNNVSIESQGEIFVQITFNPTDETTYSGNISIDSNADSGGSSIAVSGVGTISGGGNNVTCNFGEFTDPFDGETYCIVEIGGQTWMAENLRRLPDQGNALPFDDDNSNLYPFGRLYTWDAIIGNDSSSDEVPSGVQGICPDGWHLPSAGEWELLINFYGGGDFAYDDLIVEGSSGFNAQLGGSMGPNFQGGLSHTSTFQLEGFYWTCTAEGVFFPDNYKRIHFDETSLVEKITVGHKDRENTYSCRCVKD